MLAEGLGWVCLRRVRADLRRRSVHHDPDVTYSGHKGKGYEVQVTETCHLEKAVEMITNVEVTAQP